MKIPLFVWALLMTSVSSSLAAEGEDALRRAVSFYASFDEEVRGDFGGGGLKVSTRFDHPTNKGEFVFEPGFDAKVFRIAKGQGVSGKNGGALEAVDVLPRRGRIYFPMKGNLAFTPGGWGGAVSLWINTDPNTLIKSPFCDPIQITEKGANNGGLWLDFPDLKPRDMRLGAFPAVADGKTPMLESDTAAPLVWMKNVGFKSGKWHHLVMSWKNFDTGKPNAEAALYVDGKLIGRLEGRDLAMNWNINKGGIYVAVNYIGLLDELALFNRPLDEGEILLLRDKPDWLGDHLKAK